MVDLDQQKWREAIEKDTDAVILDVRTEEEFEAGYIPEAILADIQNPQGFMSKLEELDKAKNYYVYCRSGGRSTQACQIMEQMGFNEAYNLHGGFSEWEGERNE